MLCVDENTPKKGAEKHCVRMVTVVTHSDRRCRFLPGKASTELIQFDHLECLKSGQKTDDCPPRPRQAYHLE